MRYIDTGSRDERHALATWFNDVLRPDVRELRWQSGFFFADGASLLVPTLERLRNSGGLVRGVIGANLGTTLRADVKWLADTIGLPRNGASLGLVSFSGGLYHPKCYHVRRDDGSQSAYVGSGNLTAPGVSGRNIEAALVLDTREGDRESVLQSVAAGVDYWLDQAREGFHLMEGDESIAAAYEAGILVDALPPRRELPAEAADDNETEQEVDSRPQARPLLRPLVRIPSVRGRRPAREAPPSRLPVEAAQLPVVPRDRYPESFFFAPDAAAATIGRSALSGATLPRGAVGVVVRLNKDSARHFEGGPGTANMSIPLATAHTLRFGLLRHKYTRPRSEFDLRVRYIAHDTRIAGEPLDTNVMAYGYEEGEPGHKDLRLVIPAGVRVLGERVEQAGYAVPTVDNPAFLEWPTPDRPDFRLSYLEPGSALARIAEDLLSAAERTGEVVGHGAAWLPPGVSPEWP